MATAWGVLEQRGRGLAEEASASVNAGRVLDPGWLESAACWLADGAAPWAELFGTPSGRQYRLITSCLHLEAWLICWPEQGRLALHDHGGASGALRVIDGTLTEQYVLERRLPARRRTLSAGTGVSFDGSYIHDVANTRSELATSVHVYSAAERRMAHYHLTPAGLVERLDGHDDALVVPETESVPGPQDLHPSAPSRR